MGWGSRLVLLVGYVDALALVRMSITGTIAFSLARLTHA